MSRSFFAALRSSRCFVYSHLNGRAVRTFADKAHGAEKIGTQTSAKATESLSSAASQLGYVSPSPSQRQWLVRTGYYKTLEDVPRLVPFEQLSKAKDGRRVGFSVVMMAFAVGCSITILFLARRDHWKKMNDEHPVPKDSYAAFEAYEAQHRAPKSA